MHEQIYRPTWVLCEVFVVKNFNFLLVWIVCSHIHSFRLLVRLHLQRGVFRHPAICINGALLYAGYVYVHSVRQKVFGKLYKRNLQHSFHNFEKFECILIIWH